jgi:hypothetical protein
MAGSPTARSLAEMRGRGFTAAVTEHWNPFAHIRQDLYGFIDILCFQPGQGTVAVQATSTSNIGSRIEKIKALPLAKKWLETENAILVHGWAKRGGRGERKLWTLVEKELVLSEGQIVVEELQEVS